MSVTVSKYLGYVVDIKNEWDKLLDEQQDIWMLSKEKETSKYKPYYVIGNPENRITVVHDGMSGEYTKLVYVIAYCGDTNDDDIDMVERINQNLIKDNVSMDVRWELEEIYKQMFNVEQLENLKIQMEYFIHWS